MEILSKNFTKGCHQTITQRTPAILQRLWLKDVFHIWSGPVRALVSNEVGYVESRYRSPVSFHWNLLLQTYVYVCLLLQSRAFVQRAHTETDSTGVRILK